ncbi:hypothetical protein KDK_26640 [Dictyobacter kobayashii]|uniref:Uncharacterized protein n=1 Tax=Dictyobacter kobayashii TaxID=2014872 RepID=A0A402AII7_9CHLR|nr:hypothetical protein KDK_26640 [Dictyobacter kobayashii]
MFYQATVYRNVDNGFYSKIAAPLTHAKRHTPLYMKCTEEDEYCQLYFSIKIFDHQYNDTYGLKLRINFLEGKYSELIGDDSPYVLDTTGKDYSIAIYSFLD